MADLYTAAESNRSDYLKMKVTYSYNANYSSTIARLTITYTITKSTSSGYTEPGARYGILTTGTAVNDNGQVTTSGSLLKASSNLGLTDITTSGGTKTGTINFDFTKGTSAVTYSGVTFFINDNNTSTTRSSDATYQWTGQAGSSVSSKPQGFAVMSFTVPIGGVAHIKVGSTWKTGVVYVKTNDGWKKGIPYIKTSGGWEIGI